MELIKILSNSNLSPLNQEIIKACSNTQLRFFTSEQKSSLSAKIYYLAKAKLGLNDNGIEQEKMIISMLTDDLNSLGSFTQEELLLVLKMGLNGEFLLQGQNQVFFNSSNFMIWAKSYLKFRQDAIGEFNRNKPKEESKPVPSDDELKRQACDAANDYADSIAKFKEAGKEYKFPYGGLHHLCKFLIKFELFKPNRQTMIDMYEQNKASFSHLQDEDWKRMVYSDLYVEFVSKMSDMGIRFNDNYELE